MKEAVIVSAVRTAIGRSSPAATLRKTRPENTRRVVVLKEIIKRTPGPGPHTDIDDVIVGNSTPGSRTGPQPGPLSS